MHELPPAQELIKRLTEAARHPATRIVWVGHVRCPRCVDQTKVEMLENSPDLRWYRCVECGHLWLAES